MMAMFHMLMMFMHILSKRFAILEYVFLYKVV